MHVHIIYATGLNHNLQAINLVKLHAYKAHFAEQVHPCSLFTSMCTVPQSQQTITCDWIHTMVIIITNPWGSATFFVCSIMKENAKN